MAKQSEDKLYEEAKRQEAMAKKLDPTPREEAKKPEAMAFLEYAIKPQQ